MTREEMMKEILELVEQSRIETLTKIADMIGGLINALENQDIDATREKAIAESISLLLTRLKEGGSK